MRIYKIGLFALVLLLLSGCKTEPEKAPAKKEKPATAVEKKLSLKVTNFGNTNYSLFHLTNKNGIEMTVSNYGGVIISLKVPDKNGESADIVLGYDNWEDYEKDTTYMGAIIGRYANRIADAKFEIDGKTYQLDKNDGNNSLHGGLEGFDKHSWVFRTVKDPDRVGVAFYRLSPDGEDGFPGELKPNISYYLDNENNLQIDYNAVTNKPTVVNLTQHSYFNLKGAGNGDVLGHEIQIMADRYLPIDKNMLPTNIAQATGTPMDFTEPKAIGKDINAEHPQLKIAGGYDHNYVLSDKPGQLISAAKVYEPTSGRTLEVLTTQPGMQFYTGNALSEEVVGKGGTVYGKHSGFCLETQHFPNSPNRPDFPSTVLRPGERFESTTIYRFGVAESNPSK